MNDIVFSASEKHPEVELLPLAKLQSNYQRDSKPNNECTHSIGTCVLKLWFGNFSTKLRQYEKGAELSLDRASLCADLCKAKSMFPEKCSCASGTIKFRFSHGHFIHID